MSANQGIDAELVMRIADELERRGLVRSKREKAANGTHSNRYFCWRRNDNRLQNWEIVWNKQILARQYVVWQTPDEASACKLANRLADHIDEFVSVLER